MNRSPRSFDCLGCDREVFPDGEGRVPDLCAPCREKRDAQPMKLGMLVVAPDGAVVGAWVKRNDGRGWQSESRGGA